MASTIYTYNLTGGRVFPVAFEYLARRFVRITLVGATRLELQLNVDYRFISKTEIETTVAWNSGTYQTIEVRRVTSATDRLVNFTDGSILRSQDLNISQIQAIHIAEEGRDVADNAMISDGFSWNALGRQIGNVGYPSDHSDASTVSYVLDQIGRTLRGTQADRLTEIPADRANKVLSFDSNRQPIAINPSAGSSMELELDLRNTTDASKGSGIIGNSISVVPTVAIMAAMSGWAIGQKVQTLGYYIPGDGGGNHYIIQAAGSAVVDGGQYLAAGNMIAKGLFGDGVTNKQCGAVADGAPTFAKALQSAIDLSISENPTAAFGAETRVKLGITSLDTTVRVAGDRTVKGTGGQNATKLVAKLASWISGTSVVSLTGAFSKLMNIGVRVDADLYNPATATGTSVSCVTVSEAKSFGNVIRDVRTNGGDIGYNIAAGLETKLDGCFNTGSRDGLVVRAWDTEVHRTILQDNTRYGVETTRGLESSNLHIVRSGVAAVYLRDSGAPVNMHGTFIDTPANMGFRLAAQRGSMISSSYILKIGDNKNPSASGVRLETGASYNAFIGGNVVNSGSNYGGVFSIDSTSINNVIAFWKIASKAVVPASQRYMWAQTVIGCMDDAARYNNIPRKNRGQVSGVLAGETAQIIVTLDYAYPALTFNTLLFYGKWVSRSTTSQGAVGDIFLPIQYGDSGCSFLMNKLTGGASVSWSVETVILAGDKLTLTVRNTGSATASLSVDLERSLDATGVTF